MRRSYSPPNRRRVEELAQNWHSSGSRHWGLGSELAQRRGSYGTLSRACNPFAMATRLLVVDDDRAVRESLRRALTLEGYEVDLAEDGTDGLARVAGTSLDAIVLDVAMPGVDGLEMCRRLRRDGSSVPVLMLTARESVTDRVSGLDAGADDYLVKPFALEELLARLRALLRRTEGAAPGDVLEFADLTLDTGTRVVRRGDREMELTRTEFNLLELFLRNPRQVLTRSVIFERVWGYDFGPTSNSLEVYVGYLRRKTEAGGEPRLIHTVRGVGYALREP
jgi:two-component system, OmpR family, response regulator MprA